jgi:hypothetical protein
MKLCLIQIGEPYVLYTIPLKLSFRFVYLVTTLREYFLALKNVIFQQPSLG